ncbi:uncharacterized protein KZ484_017390 isoform 2-T3 [Pholidichthys leucotaenia]
MPPAAVRKTPPIKEKIPDPEPEESDINKDAEQQEQPMSPSPPVSTVSPPEGRRNAGIQAPENKKKKKRIARNWEDESQPAQLNPAQEAELVVWFSQHPEYYWKMADGFKNTKAKREAMEKKAAELGISYDRLDRWHRTMRDAYTNARRKQAGRSGSKPLAPRERWVLQNFSFWEDKLHYKGVDDNEGMFTQKIAARTPSSKAASAVAAAAVDPFFVDEEDIAIGNIHPQVSSSDEEEEAAVQTARLDSIITSSQVRRQNQQSDGALAGSAGTIGAPHCQHPAQKRLVALDSSALQKALLKHSELAIRLGNDVTTLLKSTKQDPMVAYGMYLGSIPPTLEEELQDEFVARTTELMQEFIRRNRALQKQKAEKQQQVLQERQLRQQQQPKPPHIISTVTATSQPPLFQQQQRLSQHSPYQMPSQSLPCFNPYSTDEGDVPVCQWNS